MDCSADERASIFSEPMSDTPKQIVQAFYAAFAAHDGDKMAAAYADNATFSDPVFPSLRGKEVGAMWRMLTSRAKELVLTVDEILEDGPTTIIARWTAVYPFTSTGNMVTNHVTSTLRIENGKITTQRDVFDFAAWQAQALGAFGRFLGWTGLPGSIVRKKAAEGLQIFMSKNG